MSTLKDQLETGISDVFNTTWSIRQGQVVPATDDVALANGAVELDVVMLYADLAKSTELANYSKRVAAKIVRAYLSSATRLVTYHGGKVRSFDGDRVMGVFVGDSKNTNAAKCALRMNYVLLKQLRPAVQKKFPSLIKSGIQIDHCVGVADGKAFVVRGGVRGSNDLVFIGRAPNIAAKLSDIRNDDWNTYITWSVYKWLNKNATYSSEGKNMWISVSRTIGKDKWDLYKSRWWWSP